MVMNMKTSTSIFLDFEGDTKGNFFLAGYQSNEKFEAYGQSKAIQDPLDEKLEVLLMRLKKAEEEISNLRKSKG